MNPGQRLNALRLKTRRIWLEIRALREMYKAGLVGPDKPSRLREVGDTMRTYGAFGATSRIAAIKHGDRPAIADERGELTYNQLDERVNRLSNALSAKLPQNATIGVLCRNHGSALTAAIAAGRAGLNMVWLNTDFSGPQCSEVCEREGVDLLVYDLELAERLTDLTPTFGKYAIDITSQTDELEELLSTGSPALPPPPSQTGQMIVLTSGTTGTPKGARRAEAKGLIITGGLLQKLPMRSREASIIVPPLFHGTGLAIAMLTMGLGGKLVLRRRYDALAILEDIEKHKVSTVCVVPVILQRILALGADTINGRDLSSLRIVFCAGSQLPPSVAVEAQRLLGDVVHVLYGSTEASAVTIASPADLKAEPGTVGKPLMGTYVRLLDERGAPVKQGETGRIFVSSYLPFEGYTGGGGKEIIDGFMSTGDVGHFDSEGRLFIDGRDDEMIVSGGENVYPREVEDLLISHPAIVEAAAIAVEDAEFGSRLRVFVVYEDGRNLSEDEVRTFVRGNLARYKVPRDVIAIDELPRNPTGKVLKRELAAR